MDWKTGTIIALGLTTALWGCGDDGGSGGTDADASTGGSTTTTSTSTSTTTTTTTSTSTTTTTTTSTTSTTGGSTGTDGGDTDRFCTGLDRLGPVADVLSRNMQDVGMMCSNTEAACGGDLVGEWTMELNCGEENSPNLFGSLCPGATQTVTLRSLTGTITFNDDDTFDRQLTSDLEFTTTVDVQTCLGITCAQFQTLLDDDPDSSGTCTGEDTACECDVDFTGVENDAGTYSVADDAITFTVDGDDSAPVPFCVMNDRLDLWTPQFQPTFTLEPCADATDCETALGDQYEAYVCEEDDEEEENASLGPRLGLPIRR